MRALEETLRQVFPLDSAEEEIWRSRLLTQAETQAESAVVAARLASRLAGIGRGPLHPHQPLLAVFTAAHGLAMKKSRPHPEPPPAGPSQMGPSLVEAPPVEVGSDLVIPAPVIPVPTMSVPAVVVDMGGGDNSSQVMAKAMMADGMAAAATALSRPVAAASADISRGPAMSIAMARAAMEAGIALAEEWRQYDLFAVACQDQSRGPGVLYAASAIAARCLGEYKESDLPVGVERALLAEILSAACDGRTGLELLAALGGFDLGGAAGLMLALAARQRPIILGDFAATTAALVAARQEPFIRDYLFAATVECPLHRAALAFLGAPLLVFELAPEVVPGKIFQQTFVKSICQSITAMIAASSLFVEAGRA